MPVQLLLLHLRKNYGLIIYWLILFAIVVKAFGRSMGIPYLFLDPEYQNEVSFTSFFIVGVSLAFFTVSFYITSYIIDGPRFNFIAWLNRPFTRFSINNSVVIFLFLIIYTYQVIIFQQENYIETNKIVVFLTGFYCGFLSTIGLMFLYFRVTNKDIFKYMVCKLDEKLKRKVKVTRARAMSRLASAKSQQIRTTTFIDSDFKFKEVPDYKGFYDKETVLQVFDQNHLNLISVELFIFALLLFLGLFSDIPMFQIPAAASFVLLISFLIMFTGAFEYWFRRWSLSIFILAIILLNFLIQFGVINKQYQAFGIHYNGTKSIYNLDGLSLQSNPETRTADYESTLLTLNKWRAGFPIDQPPKMVLICASGGGQRSMLWTLNALQHADSVTNRELMNQTRLITGASGGVIGAGFFRELILRNYLDSTINPQDTKFLQQVGQDNLNPIIFSLLVNDFFLGFQKYKYNDQVYVKDRGFAFEQQLNRNTSGFMDKSLFSYRKYEEEAIIPMLILSPTVVNDGRKMYISPMDIAYMTTSLNGDATKFTKAIEFKKMFKDQAADSLRYLSALRMSATFPYITPNITLPSIPPMEIMDAGLTDNYGVSDATRFMYVFSDWIERNTSGVVFLLIRDSQKMRPIEEKVSQSMFQKFFSPLQGFYKNFENIQDFSNDDKLEQMKKWFKGNVNIVQLEYNSANNEEIKERASLNWRLTSREKESILENIHSEKNKSELDRLKNLLKPVN